MPIEVPRQGGKNNGVAICVQATYGHIKRHLLVEWFETQRLLGVTYIGIYASPMTHPETRRTLTQYDGTPLAQLRTIDYIDGTSGKGHFLMVNLAAINDCIYRRLYTHQFVAVIDFDEVCLNVSPIPY